MQNNIIRYRQVRSVGGVLNDTFRYFTRHLKSIIRLLLVYAIPFFAVSMIAGLYYSGSAGFQGKVSILSRFVETDPVETALVLVTWLAGIMFHNFIFNRHLMANEAGETLPRSFAEYKDWILNGLRLHAANMFFLLVAVVFFAALMLAALNGPLASEVRVSFADDPIYFFLQQLPLLVTGLVISPLICFMSVSALFYSLREKTGIFPALRNSWHYVKNNFFTAWGTSVLSLLIIWLLTILCKLPLLLLSFLVNYLVPVSELTLYKTYFVISHCYDTVVYLLIAGFLHILCVFQFTSFEEQQEGVAIREKIEEIK